MNFLDLAKNRYTTKKYNPEQKITSTQIEELKEIIRLSPSSINSQPWKFSFISDKDTLEKLASVSYFNAEKIEKASHLVVFSALDDITTFENQIAEHLPEGSVNYYKQFIQPLPEKDIKAWLQHQVYLSLGYFLSACASMNIDSTPMEGIKTEEYKNILQLQQYQPLFAVAIGYRDIEDSNQPTIKPKSRLPLLTVIQEI